MRPRSRVKPRRVGFTSNSSYRSDSDTLAFDSSARCCKSSASPIRTATYRTSADRAKTRSIILGVDTDTLRHLTVKLRGRPEAPDQAPRAHNLFRARGA